MKLIHTADWHLGAEISALPAGVRERAQQLRWQAMEETVRLAGREGADALLIAGDVFHRPDATGEVVRRAFALLAAAPCPVLIAPGNHDYIGPDSPYARGDVPDNVHVFTRPVLTPHPVGDGVVWGAGFDAVQCAIPLSAAVDRGRPAAALVHGDRLSQSGYNPVGDEVLAAAPFDYVALGHNHQRLSGPGWAAPGTPAAAGYDEPGEHGCLIVTVAAGGSQARFVPLTMAPRFERRVLTGPGREQEQELALLLQLGGRLALQLTLRGERGADDGAVQALLNRGAGLLAFEVLDERQAARPLWRREGEDSLAGEVTALARAYLDGGGDRERGELALRLALEALEG